MGFENYDPSAGPYDPGQVVIFFDNRLYVSQKDQFSSWQARWMQAKYRMGWPSLWAQDLEPGKIRIIWYTHVGTEGKRDYPLWKAYAVLEMFEALSTEGFRPMILGWSGENPFPMIGGSEPPPEPNQNKPRVATSWSNAVSGHGQGGVHDRVMKIIEAEEEREAAERRKLVGKADIAV